MSREQWNSRYSQEEFIYGTRPNVYLKAFLDTHPPGRILLPAEGEGRNAVYAAACGWEVDAFDQSEAGRDKAIRFAEQKRVSITYTLSSLEDWKPVERSYDCVALVFVHVPPEIRVLVHQKAIQALKPGGYLVLEAFTRNQLPRTSGGPKNLDLLFDANEIKGDFESLEIIDFTETQIELDEGVLHQGIADVVRLVGKKS